MSLANNVFVVEDQKEARARICAAIENDAHLTLWGQASSIHETLEHFATDLPAKALINLGLPDGSGEALIAWLREHASQVETLVLTVFGDTRNVVTAIQSGAFDYFLKGDTAENLAESIKHVLQGESPISLAVARYILNSAREGGDALSRSTDSPSNSRIEKPNLTLTEIEILSYNSEIAEITGRSKNIVPDHVKIITRSWQSAVVMKLVHQTIQLRLIGSS